MPALTELRLQDSIPDDSDGPSTYPVVDLPYLRLLDISSGVGALTAVLRHITFPHSAILSLTCIENQSIQIDFSNFLSVLATKFLSSLVIRSLSLQVSRDAQIDGLEFYCTTAIIEECSPFPLSFYSQLQLALKWPWPQRDNHAKALTCAFNAMSLPFLTQLHLSTFNYIDSQTLVKTFGKLPLLERVDIEADAGTTHQFLEALVYKTKAAEISKTAAYHNVSFPKLRYILLEEVEFGARTSGSLSVDMLLDYLMERCERKAEVQVLRLDHCHNISSDDVKRLKEIVVDVIFNGFGWDCDYDFILSS